METTNAQRKEQLRKVSETYFDSLRRKDFSAIPFSEEVILRVPLAPGGVHNPIKGKQAAFDQWWKPLEGALEGLTVKIIDHFYNDAMTSIISKAEITLAGPGITLRVADRFIVNEKGEITEQENHFDASPLKG